MVEQEESRPVAAEEPQQEQEGMRSPTLEDIPSKPVTLQRPRDLPEEFQRDPPPHIGGLEQDVRRAPFTRREDGLRIDRNRTSISEPTPRSGNAPEPSSEPVLGETRASQEGAETQLDKITEQPPSASPPIEAAKSIEGRQTTLLERISNPVEYEGDGMAVDDDQSGAVVDKRKPRGKRSNRGARR